MNEKNSRQALYYVLLLLVVILWTLVYAIPRYRQISELNKESQGYVMERQTIANSLAAFQRSQRDLPAPQPNTVSWLTKNALAGLEKHLECNNPFNNGLGAQVKLRNITADDITELMEKLCTVNLVIKSCKLEDQDGNGRWNLDLMVEVPS